MMNTISTSSSATYYRPYVTQSSFLEDSSSFTYSTYHYEQASFESIDEMRWRLFCGKIRIPKLYQHQLTHWSRKVVRIKKRFLFNLQAFKQQINKRCSWEYFGSSIASRLRNKKLV